MKKVLILAAVLAVAGCGEKKAEGTPADAAPTADSTMTDSTMARDTSRQM